MKNKKLLVALTVVTILVGSFVTMQVLIKTKPESKKAPSRKVVIGVKTTPVNLSDYTLEVTYPGKVAAREMVTLASEVSGKLLDADVPLKVGQRFKKGDVILRIYSQDVRASYTANVSQFLNTLANTLPDIKLDLPTEYDKWYAFFNSIDIDKKLPALPKINTDKEKIYLAAKNILTSYYNLAQTQIVLSRYQVVAPFNGVFTSVSKEVGAVASMNSEVAQIRSTDQLELVVGVPLENAQILSVGTEMNVVSNSGKSYKGIIDRIASFVDEKTQRVNVYVLFNEPGLDIITGQMLNLTIPSKEITSVQEIAREAVVNDSIVFVVKNDQLQPQKVELVASTSALSYVSGVAMGDTIVNESLVSPYEGMPVRKLDMEGNLIGNKK